MAQAALAEIARLLKVQNHSAKSVIVRTGQPGDSMYFIAEGEVEVHAGAARIRLKPGQFFGEAALITGGPRNATVVAAGPARLLRLDVIEFRELAARQPELLTIIQAEAAHRAAKPTLSTARRAARALHRFHGSQVAAPPRRSHPEPRCAG